MKILNFCGLELCCLFATWPIYIYIYIFCKQSLPNRKEALIVSAWPSTSLPRQAESVKKFENLQALVSVILLNWLVIGTVTRFWGPWWLFWICCMIQTRAIRNARAEYSVEPAKRISASIVANADVIQYISVSWWISWNLSSLTEYDIIYLLACSQKRYNKAKSHSHIVGEMNYYSHWHWYSCTLNWKLRLPTFFCCLRCC